ncbi:hypothetical protein [Streptomyces olivochromogenes]|uniref:hypothetical protein n=1 Tax=Streptomyces olivochromogenes TaxID=1963 RepID=UPI003695EF43
MITKEQLEQAEAKASTAEQVRTEAQKTLGREPHSRRAAQAAVDATQAAAAAARDLRRLREDFEEQEAARREDRAAAERAAAKEVRAAGKDLPAARQKVTAAAARAQEALAALVVEAGAYNALTERHAGVLASAGLDLEGGQNGGGRELSGPVVMVEGLAYAPADPGAVVGALVTRLAASLPRSHRLAMATRNLPGGDRAAALLADVPAVTVEWAAPVRAMGGVGSAA